MLKSGSLSNFISHVKTLKIILWNNFLFTMWTSILPAKLGRKIKNHLLPLHLNLAFLTIKIYFINYTSYISKEPLLIISSDILKDIKHLLKYKPGEVSLFTKTGKNIIMKEWTFFVCLILVFVSCSCARMLIASLLKGGCFFLCCLSFPKALFPHRSQGTICLFFWQEFLPIVLHPGGFQLGLLLPLFPCSSSKICPVTTLVGPWSVTVPANPSASLVPFVISHHDCNLAFFFSARIC